MRSVRKIAWKAYLSESEFAIAQWEHRPFAIELSRNVLDVVFPVRFSLEYIAEQINGDIRMY